jgi:hypothetical protein
LQGAECASEEHERVFAERGTQIVDGSPETSTIGPGRTRVVQPGTYTYLCSTGGYWRTQHPPAGLGADTQARSAGTVASSHSSKVGPASLASGPGRAAPFA